VCVCVCVCVRACVCVVCACVQLYCCICTSVFFVSSAIDSFAETILSSLGSSATLPVHFKITSLVRLILFTLPIVAQTLLAFVINLYPAGMSLCNTLQHTASHCNTLQHTATHCNIHPAHRRADPIGLCYPFVPCRHVSLQVPSL